jgi:hypothetical protein
MSLTAWGPAAGDSAGDQFAAGTPARQAARITPRQLPNAGLVPAAHQRHDFRHIQPKHALVVGGLHAMSINRRSVLERHMARSEGPPYRR